MFDRLLARSSIDDFNGAQGRILYILWQHESLPIKEISKYTGLAKNTLTSMLARMEAAALIERTADLKDRRCTNVILSTRAKNLFSDYERVSQQMNDIYFKGFTEEEIEILQTALARVLTNLEQYERTGTQDE